jgi:hypothetical protein
VQHILESNVRPTLRGLVTGSLKLGKQVDAMSVVVWGHEFPSWLLVLGELHLRARVVVLASTIRWTLVKSFVEQAFIIVTLDKAWELLRPDMVDNSSLCLIDGRVSSETARFLQTCSITRILGTKGIRRNIPGWSHSTWTGCHARLGGVTTASVTGVCLAVGEQPLLSIEQPDEVGCDASTVLSIKAPARQYRLAPSHPLSHHWAVWMWERAKLPVFMVEVCCPETVTARLWFCHRVYTLQKASGHAES